MQPENFYPVAILQPDSRIPSACALAVLGGLYMASCSCDPLVELLDSLHYVFIQRVNWHLNVSGNESHRQSMSLT